METIVRVREGQLEGCRSADQKSIIFKGVPYAEPPVGALRCAFWGILRRRLK